MKQNSKRWYLRGTLITILLLCCAGYFHPAIHQTIQQRINDSYTEISQSTPEITVDHRLEIIDPIPGKTISSGFAWPQFRGLQRDAISLEENLLQKWPAEGPTKLFTIKGIGEGYSSPAIYGNYIVVTGEKGGVSWLYCLNSQGEMLWYNSNGPAFECHYAGTRSTPTIEDGRVYVLSANGRVACFDLETGKEIWFFQFPGDIIEYGLAESPLVYQDKVICTPGIKDMAVIALDKNTGQLLWKCEDNYEDVAGYGSPLLIETLGTKQVIVTLHSTVISVNPYTGQSLWTYSSPFRKGEFRQGRICMMPVAVEDKVFVMGGERCGGGLVRLDFGENNTIRATEVWNVPKAKSHFGGYIHHEGAIYGSDGKGWLCRDVATGEELCRLSEIKRASTIWGNERFICVEEKGMVYLLQANKQQGYIVSQFQLPKDERAMWVWARPCIAYGRLYIRNKERLHVYNISR